MKQGGGSSPLLSSRHAATTFLAETPGRSHLFHTRRHLEPEGQI